MCFCQHTSSSVARADTREPATLGAWLVLTAGWLFLLCWNLITLLYFPSTPMLPQGLDLLQRLSCAVVTKFSGAGRNSAADRGTWWMLADLNDVFKGREPGRQTGNLGSELAGETHQRAKEDGGFTYCSAGKGRTDQKDEKLHFNCLCFCVMLQLVNLKELNCEMISLFMNPLMNNSKTAARRCELLEMCSSNLQENRNEKRWKKRSRTSDFQFWATIELPLSCTSD